MGLNTPCESVRPPSGAAAGVEVEGDGAAGPLARPESLEDLDGLFEGEGLARSEASGRGGRTLEQVEDGIVFRRKAPGSGFIDCVAVHGSLGPFYPAMPYRIRLETERTKDHAAWFRQRVWRLLRR